MTGPDNAEIGDGAYFRVDRPRRRSPGTWPQLEQEASAGAQFITLGVQAWLSGGGRSMASAMPVTSCLGSVQARRDFTGPASHSSSWASPENRTPIAPAIFATCLDRHAATDHRFSETLDGSGSPLRKLHRFRQLTFGYGTLACSDLAPCAIGRCAPA
jgi:hypothetical protein